MIKCHLQKKWMEKNLSSTTENDVSKTFTEWSNTGDTVTVKVEQPISDGFTN